MKNKLKCVQKKFCERKLNISDPAICHDRTQNKLKEFQAYIKDDFIEIILGNISLGRDNYMRRRYVETVLDSLANDIEFTVDAIIYTETKKASGIVSGPKSTPVTWIGDSGFDQFRDDFVRGIRSLFPDLKSTITDNEIVPNSVYDSETIEDVHKKVKKTPYKEIENQIKQFCQ